MSSPLRILVVEDEWLIAQDYVDHLTAAGHRVLGPVPSAKAALEVLSASDADLALLDVNLIDHKSYDLADRLQERRMPFAFLTGYRAEEIPKRFAGVPILQKPVAKRDLLGAVTTLAQHVA